MTPLDVFWIMSLVLVFIGMIVLAASLMNFASKVGSLAEKVGHIDKSISVDRARSEDSLNRQEHISSVVDSISERTRNIEIKMEGLLTHSEDHNRRIGMITADVEGLKTMINLK